MANRTDQKVDLGEKKGSALSGGADPEKRPNAGNAPEEGRCDSESREATLTLPTRLFTRALWVLLIACVGMVGICFVLAREPDFDLVLSRSYSAEADVARWSQLVENIPQWKKWFFQAESVTRVDFRGEPLTAIDQKPEVGALVRLKINPKKGAHRIFFLTLKVKAYEPKREIQFEVLEDSKGKLSPLVRDLEWKFTRVDASLSEAETAGKKFQMSLEIKAKTSSWRARMFGRLTPGILLNQLNYIDVDSFIELLSQSAENPYY